MGCWMRFFVPASKKDLALEEEGYAFRASQVLDHYGCMRSFIAQIFPIYDDVQTIPHYPLPEGFKLVNSDEDITHNTGGMPLYYVLAGDVAKLEFDSDDVSPLDHGMMAYIRSLPKDHPLVPCVLY